MCAKQALERFGAGSFALRRIGADAEIHWRRLISMAEPRYPSLRIRFRTQGFQGGGWALLDTGFDGHQVIPDELLDQLPSAVYVRRVRTAWAGASRSLGNGSRFGTAGFHVVGRRPGKSAILSDAKRKRGDHRVRIQGAIDVRERQVRVWHTFVAHR